MLPVISATDKFLHLDISLHNTNIDIPCRGPEHFQECVYGEGEEEFSSKRKFGGRCFRKIR